MLLLESLLEIFAASSITMAEFTESRENSQAFKMLSLFIDFKTEEKIA